MKQQPGPYTPGPHPQGPYAPGPYAPMPPRPPRRSTGIKVLLGLVIAFGVFIALAVSGAMLSDAEHAANDRSTTAPKDDKPAADKPQEKTPAEDDKDPKPEKKAPATGEYGDGDYVVGEDIPAGAYESAGAKKGLFELCSISTDPADSSTFPQWKSANADERVIIKLTEADGVVSISGCEPLKLRK